MQTKKQSVIETLTNLAIGYVISLISLFIIFPILGIASTTSKNIGITLYFTVISFLRSYIIRRWFAKKKPKPNYVEGITLHCFDCEMNMPVIKEKGFYWCANCGFRH